MLTRKISHITLIVMSWSCIHAFLFYALGIQDQFVDSGRYIKMADHLIANGNFEYVYQIFYSVPVSLLAAFRFMFRNEVIAFVVFQSILSLFAAFALYHAASRLFRSEVSGLVSALSYLLWFDCLRWNTAVMTESLASSVICFTLYYLMRFDFRLRDYLIISGLLLINILVRPTGVILLVGVSVFILTRYFELQGHRPIRSFVLISFCGLALVAGGVPMVNHWDFTDQYKMGNIVTYMDTIEGQAHYSDRLRLETRGLTMPAEEMSPFRKIIFFATHNPLHFFKSAILKVFYTVSWYRPYFSVAHNVYTVIWLLIIYTLFCMGFRRIPEASVRNLVVTVISANCILVAISSADWDNRFFLPMQPVIVLLTGAGAAYILRLVKGEMKVFSR